MTARVVMVQGTASSVGKSTLVAGLCRALARRGVHVAPFKAQNMSNNAAVCPGGGEIGRAQYAQAIAAGVEPSVDMNPILLKPQVGTSQLIVRGKLEGTRSAREYFGPAAPDLWPVVTDALDRLRAQYDVVVVEGAGSPAEINLRERDLVNMRVARHAQAHVLLVADIDRGGAFAALLGTWEWLEPDERALVRGFILNKFRGDPTLLAPAPALLEERTGVPVVGIVPYLEDLALPEEDAASLSVPRQAADCLIEIAVIRLPHLANFDEFRPLGSEPGIGLRYVSRPEELRAPDLVVLPGTKATIPDLLWLAKAGLADRIRWLVGHRHPVLGICGGFQMLGSEVSDPGHVESSDTSAPGLDLLPLTTEISHDKRLAQVQGHFSPGLAGLWSALADVRVAGYEIHVGRTRELEPTRVALLRLASAEDGMVRRDGLVAGTYVHGLFEQAQPRQALLHALAAARGYAWQPGRAQRDPYNRIADAIDFLSLWDSVRAGVGPASV
jgi:adenosylcobyric acid synthase